MRPTKPTLSYASANRSRGRKHSKLTAISFILNVYSLSCGLILINAGSWLFYGQESVVPGLGLSIWITFIASLAFAIGAKCDRTADPSLGNDALIAWGVTAAVAVGWLVYALHNMPNC